MAQPDRLRHTFDHEGDFERLKALESCHVLDTPPEDAYDSIVHIMSENFNVPIAVITLVDKNRTWFKSHYGTDLEELPREMTMCSRVIMQGDVLVVQDLKKRMEHKEAPELNAFKLGFYAGAPITVANRYNVGAVCLIDRKPRPEFGEDQKAKLKEYATIVSHMLSSRRELYRETEKNMAKSEYLHTLAHEMKTPLGVISGISKILLDSKDIPDGKMNLIRVLNQSSNSMTELLSTINDIGLIEKRKIILDIKEFSLKNLVSELQMMMNTFARARSLDIDFDCRKIEDIRIRTDRSRLKQVLLNVIGNAIKYTDEGGVHLRVLPYSPYLNRDDYIEFQIKDTGIGIPEDEAKNVFKSYTRASNHQKRREGTGLGLSIAKHIVDKMGGAITFDSVVGEGSTFKVCIPKQVDA